VKGLVQAREMGGGDLCQGQPRRTTLCGEGWRTGERGATGGRGEGVVSREGVRRGKGPWGYTLEGGEPTGLILRTAVMQACIR